MNENAGLGNVEKILKNTNSVLCGIRLEKETFYSQFI